MKLHVVALLPTSLTGVNYMSSMGCIYEFHKVIFNRFLSWNLSADLLGIPFHLISVVT